MCFFFCFTLRAIMLYRPSVYCRRPFKINAASLSIASSEATQQTPGCRRSRCSALNIFCCLTYVMVPVLNLMLNKFQTARCPVVGRFPPNFRITPDNWENSQTSPAAHPIRSRGDGAPRLPDALTNCICTCQGCDWQPVYAQMTHKTAAARHGTRFEIEAAPDWLEQKARGEPCQSQGENSVRSRH